MKRLFNGAAALLAGAIAMGLAGIASAADPVRIGFSLPKTGIFAPAAASQDNAYELWREQVNAKGGSECRRRTPHGRVCEIR